MARPRESARRLSQPSKRKSRSLFACLREAGPRDRRLFRRNGLRLSGVGGHRVLGENAVAITADSASIPGSHKRDAEAFAREFGFRHEYIETHEFENPDYVKNDANRCFHCKDELFTRLESFAAARGMRHIVYGVNMDDLGDYRPGQRAAKLHGVQAPLVEAGLTKAEIRELSRRAGLSTWDRPASACLEFARAVWNPGHSRDDPDYRAGRRGDSRRLASGSSVFAFTASWRVSRSRAKKCRARSLLKSRKPFQRFSNSLAFYT